MQLAILLEEPLIRCALILIKVTLMTTLNIYFPRELPVEKGVLQLSKCTLPMLLYYINFVGFFLPSNQIENVKSLPQALNTRFLVGLHSTASISESIQ